MNTSFDTFKNQTIENFWQINPSWAVIVGNHKFDDKMTVLDTNYHKAILAFAESTRKTLATFPNEKLNTNNQIDKEILDNQMAAIIWSENDFREWEWNPAIYNIGEELGLIINGTYAPVETRLQALSRRLLLVPSYFAAAQNQIHNPTLEHTELAIAQAESTAGVFDEGFFKTLESSKLSESEKSELKTRVKTTIQCFNDYANWLNKTIKPTLANGKARSFRIGKKLYDKKFEFEISAEDSAEAVYQKALQRKTKLHDEMFALTQELWSKYLPGVVQPSDKLAATKMMIDKIAKKHVTREGFFDSIKTQIPELEKFIRDHDLITLDPDKPLEVRKEPGYMGGIAGASISAPGPYDASAKTFYNVAPLDNYTPAEAESFLREYNHYVLQILNIHEAIPGHYVQLIYSNKAPSLVKSLFGNTAMVEGWAVYGELMMIEQGYGDHTPEMRLMYDKWNLRATCNFLLDYGVHVLNMTQTDALHLLQTEAFQEQAEAEGKWRRVTLTQVQLTSYFSGFMEIYTLREELKKKLGDRFNLKAFHEAFLSYGSAPVKLIAQELRNSMSSP